MLEGVFLRTDLCCLFTCRLTDLLFDPTFPFQRLTRLGDSQHLQQKLLEDARLCLLETITLPQPVLPLMTPFK